MEQNKSFTVVTAVYCDDCDAKLHQNSMSFSHVNKQWEMRVAGHRCSVYAAASPTQPVPLLSRRETVESEAKRVLERLRAWPAGFEDALSSMTVGHLLVEACGVITALQLELAEGGE